jgi:hypothetical protein
MRGRASLLMTVKTDKFLTSYSVKELPEALSKYYSTILKNTQSSGIEMLTAKKYTGVNAGVTWMFTSMSTT